MIEIVSAQSGEALDALIGLSQDYVTWMLDEVRSHYPQLDTQEFSSEHDYDNIRKKFPGEHVPPHGCLLIAKNGEDVCGCIAIGRLSADICEMRTLFVRPECRGMGIGKALAEASLHEARRLGYQTVRLDTLAFMESAQSLYRSMGFYAIEPYLDMSDSLKQYIRFFECKL
jgi:ribosomal protein S18 acetylase RimI-like enzyme